MNRSFQQANPQQTQNGPIGSVPSDHQTMSAFTDAFSANRAPNGQFLPQQQQAPQPGFLSTNGTMPLDPYQQQAPIQLPPAVLPPMPDGGQNYGQLPQQYQRPAASPTQAPPQQPAFYQPQQTLPFVPQQPPMQQPAMPPLPPQPFQQQYPPTQQPPFANFQQPPQQQLSPLMAQAQQLGLNITGIQNDGQLLAQMSQMLEAEKIRTNQANALAMQSSAVQQPQTAQQTQQTQEPWTLQNHLSKAWNAPQRDPTWDFWISQGHVQRGADGLYVPSPGNEFLLAHQSFQNLNAFETAQRRIDQTTQLWNVIQEPISRVVEDSMNRLWQERFVEQQTREYLDQFQRTHAAMLANPVTRDQFFGHVSRLESGGMQDDRLIAETALQLMQQAGYQAPQQFQQQPQFGQQAPPMMSQNQFAHLDPSVYGPPPQTIPGQNPYAQFQQQPVPQFQPPVQFPPQNMMPQPQVSYSPTQAFMHAAVNSSGAYSQATPQTYGQDVSGEMSQYELENMFTTEYRRMQQPGQWQYPNAAA